MLENCRDRNQRRNVFEPAHPYTWALLSSMPDLQTKEKLLAIPGGTPPNMLNPPKGGDAFAARNQYAMEIDLNRSHPILNFQIHILLQHGYYIRKHLKLSCQMYLKKEL